MDKQDEVPHVSTQIQNIQIWAIKMDRMVGILKDFEYVPLDNFKNQRPIPHLSERRHGGRDPFAGSLSTCMLDIISRKSWMTTG